jgi:hypothetical protein
MFGEDLISVEPLEKHDTVPTPPPVPSSLPSSMPAQDAAELEGTFHYRTIPAPPPLPADLCGDDETF